MPENPAYYVTADAPRLAAQLLDGDGEAGLIGWMDEIRHGWRHDPEVPRFGGEEHIEGGWA